MVKRTRTLLAYDRRITRQIYSTPKMQLNNHKNSFQTEDKKNNTYQQLNNNVDCRMLRLILKEAIYAV